jgi:RNA-binding protein 5/10
MVRGLAQHITEGDIRDDIQSCDGLIAKDIRLIRKKETGTSEGSKLCCIAIRVYFPQP